MFAGTTGVNNTGSVVVENLGWDQGTVSQGAPLDYVLQDPLVENTLFTATLTWFTETDVDFDTLTFDDSFDDLDLEVWLGDGAGNASTLLAESISPYNTSEHLQFTTDQAGEYIIRVVWESNVWQNFASGTSEEFGLAWSAEVIPAPPAVFAALALMGGLAIRRRRANQA